MPSFPPVAVRIARAVAVGLLFACSEPTTSVRRFAVLDDIGQGDWQTVTVGVEHTCGIKTGGAAFCWGNNQYGQLAVARLDTTCGSEKSTYRCSLKPQAVQPSAKFSMISAGSRHTCAITVVREAFCWGSNETGQVGDFAFTGPTLTKVPGSLGWTQISAGATHTCAVRTDGALFCWGANDRGQLGNGGFAGNTGLSRVPFTAPVAYVSAGQQHTCARTTVGAVFCWGAVWTRPGLDRRTRSLINLGMLTALGRMHEFRAHVRGAVNNGCTTEEIRETLLQATVYCGAPAGLESFREAQAVLDELAAERDGAPA